MLSSVTKTTRAHYSGVPTLGQVLQTTDTSAGMNTPECHLQSQKPQGHTSSVTKTTRAHSVSLGAALGQVVWTTETAELMNTQATLLQNCWIHKLLWDKCCKQLTQIHKKCHLEPCKTTWAHSVSLGVFETHQGMSKNSHNFCKENSGTTREGAELS